MNPTGLHLRNYRATPAKPFFLTTPPGVVIARPRWHIAAGVALAFALAFVAGVLIFTL